jgi:hypothetical protein
MRPFLGPLVERDFYHVWTHPDARMDDLHSAVSEAVAAAAGSGEDPVRTFDRVRRLTDSLSGTSARLGVAARVSSDRPRPPRLTEPWFC